MKNILSQDILFRRLFIASSSKYNFDWYVYGMGLPNSWYGKRMINIVSQDTLFRWLFIASSPKYYFAVLEIRDILMRIRGKVPLTNGSGFRIRIRLLSSLILRMQKTDILETLTGIWNG